MRAVLAVCIFLTLAGCISNDPEEIASNAVTTTSPPSAAGTAPASTTATTTAPTPPTEPHGDPPPPPEPVEKAYSFDGSRGAAAAACAPAGVDQCAGYGLRSKWWDAPKEAGIVHAKLTLSWTAAAPTAETLRFAIQRATPCGEGCWKDGKGIAPYVEGKSPLALDVDVPALNASEILVVTVVEASFAPPPLFVIAHPEQPFKIEGTLTVLPKA